MKPRKPIRRTAWLARGTTPIKRVNRKRKASEFARCYGSKARVAWVKSLPCFVCRALSPFFGGTVPSHNAHTEGGGAGRKADYTTIVPMCPTHHQRFDKWRPRFDEEMWRRAAKLAAIAVEMQWQAHLRGSDVR